MPVCTGLRCFGGMISSSFAIMSTPANRSVPRMGSFAFEFNRFIRNGCIAVTAEMNSSGFRIGSGMISAPSSPSAYSGRRLRASGFPDFVPGRCLIVNPYWLNFSAHLACRWFSFMEVLKYFRLW